MPEQLVVFRVAGEPYALPLVAVREVVAVATRRSLPAPPAPWVVGVASIRGELMPVVDLAALLGVAPSADADPPASGVLLVVEHAGRVVAVEVERVDGLLDAAGPLAPAPAYVGEAAAAIAESGGELVIVLRPAALLPPA